LQTKGVREDALFYRVTRETTTLLEEGRFVPLSSANRGHVAGRESADKAVPDNVRAAADKIVADTKAGTYEVFTDPISDQTGKERVAKGQRMEDKDLL
jgi:hypothetical protein